MHELGTVVYIIDTVDKLAVENHLTKIGSVTLEVGEVSGIIPSYLTGFIYSSLVDSYCREQEASVNPKRQRRRDFGHAAVYKLKFTSKNLLLYCPTGGMLYVTMEHKYCAIAKCNVSKKFL
mgnify:CR=1 FL=1